MIIQTIIPKKIMLSKGVSDAEILLKEKPLQIGLNEPLTAKISDGATLVLDFGKETRGSLRILTFFAKNAQMRIRFGESLSECCSEIGEKGACNDHANRDFIVTLQRLSDLTFGNTAFRFVRLDFEQGEAEIKSVLAVSELPEFRQVYSYGGEDARIKEIFDVAKHTIDLCAAGDYIWDGVKRDRLVWIGDMHPEMLALTAIYGRTENIERSLNFCRDQAPLPLWMNGFPSYSMWWIIILADYYKRTDCYEYIQTQSDYLVNLVNLLNGCVAENGEMHYSDYFTDWPTYESPAAKEGVRAINIIAAKKAAYLLQALKKDASAAQELENKLLKKEINTYGRKQVTALKYFATGRLSEVEQTSLTEGGAKGLSTFMSYYILTAIASFDRKKAVEIMKEYYGAMLDKGATTFWEDFDMDWIEGSGRIDDFPAENQKDIHGDYGNYCYKGFRHSFCHGWSCGVIEFIRECCE